MRRSFAIAFLLGSLMLGLALSGCGGDDEEAEEAPSPPTEQETSDAAGTGQEPISLVYIAGTAEAPYFLNVFEGIKAGAEGAAGDVTTSIIDAKFDSAQEVAAIETAVTRGADAVVVTPFDIPAVKGAISRAQAEGVSIASYIAEIPEADVNVVIDEVEFGTASGRLAGEFAAENLGCDVRVAVLNSDPLGPTQLDRKQGLIDGLKEECPDAEVVANQTAFLEEEALNTMSAILQRNPNLNLLLTVNEPGALGAISAIEAAGRTPGEDIHIFAVGEEQRLLDAMKAGKVEGSTTAEPWLTGKLVAENVIKLLRGEDFEADLTVPVTPFTRETVEGVDPLGSKEHRE